MIEFYMTFVFHSYSFFRMGVNMKAILTPQVNSSFLFPFPSFLLMPFSLRKSLLRPVLPVDTNPSRHYYSNQVKRSWLLFIFALFTETRLTAIHGIVFLSSSRQRYIFSHFVKWVGRAPRSNGSVCRRESDRTFNGKICLHVCSFIFIKFSAFYLMQIMVAKWF